MSFITIHFGDDQKLLFNLLCPTIILYENIKLRCGCKEQVIVDIADANGSLKSLSERPREQYASEYLQGRGNYVLLKVTKRIDSSTGKEFSTFEPLLNNLNEIYPDLMALPLIAYRRRKAVQQLRKSNKFLSAKVHSNRVNPDVGLPIQSFIQPPQKTAGQARSKPNPRGGNKQGSPAQLRAGSLAGNTLPSDTKTKSAARVSK